MGALHYQGWQLSDSHLEIMWMLGRGTYLDSHVSVVEKSSRNARLLKQVVRLYGRNLTSYQDVISLGLE